VATKRVNLDDNTVAPIPIVSRRTVTQAGNMPENRNTGTQVNSKQRPHSYRHNDDLALALVVYAKRQRRATGDVLDEAIRDLLTKYGEPIPPAGEGRP
jgi:hypothetical protein